MRSLQGFMAFFALGIFSFWILTVGTGQMSNGSAGADTLHLPDTTGRAVWAYLDSVKYAKAWRMWPGKSAFHKGTGPHGALLTTYVNPLAYDPIATRAESMPDGVIIVMENYSRDSALISHTVMYKKFRFDPDNGDWFWANYAPDGKVMDAGKVQSCMECHSKAKSSDYLFTGPLAKRDTTQCNGG
jgi:hypothetical protein